MTSEVIYGSSVRTSLRAATSVLALITFFVLIAAGQVVDAQTFTVLHTFEGSDGASPRSELILDEAGNLYGTTAFGGDLNSSLCIISSLGCGVIFEIDPNGSLSVLHTFEQEDGAFPSSGLLRDKAGNLYGEVTYYGPRGFDGAVYELDVAGTLRILHGFNSRRGDGALPTGGLVGDRAANVYGVTIGGGDGYGTVFEMNTKSGREQITYTFPSEYGNATAMGGLVRDAAGNLYGATAACALQSLCSIFKIDSSGNVTTLANIPWHAYHRMLLDSAGNLYGATTAGGRYYAGVVFKVHKSGNVTNLYTFGSEDGRGANPQGALIQDADGNLYGTTSQLPATVFKLDLLGNLTTLYTFTGGADGALPLSGVTRDAAGNLYGTTSAGGDLNCNPPSGCGVIFKISF